MVHFPWSCGCDANSPPFEEVGPARVFEAASDGEQSVGSRFRPVAPRAFEPVPDDALAGAFHEAGSDRQAALPVEVVAHSVPVGLEVADAGRDVFGPVAAWLQGGDVPVDPPGVQLLPDPAHPCLPLALVRRRRLHGVGRIFEGVAQVEDEGRSPSGQDLLADVPDARRPPCAGLRKPPPGHGHAEPRRPRLQPSETPKSDRARKHKTDFTKKYEPYPLADRQERIRLLSGLDPIGRALEKIVEELDARKTKETPADKPIPGVKGFPIFGSAFEARRNLVSFLAKQYQRMGPVFRIRLFNRNLIVLAGPASNRFLQKQGRNYLRSYEFWKDFTHELGVTRVLTSSEGREHGMLRRTLAPAYSRHNFEINLETASEIARSRVRAWPSDRPIDVVAAMQRIVTDQIGEIAIGIRPGEYQEDITTFLDTLLSTKLARQSPSFLHNRRMRKARRSVEKFWQKILADHQPGGPKHGAKNFVTEVLDLHRSDPQQMHETDLMIWAMGSFLVGLDTVALTSSFALYRILENPDILRRAAAEADAFFSDGAPTADGLQKMDVIYRTAMETFRRHPVVPASPRHVGTGFEFSGYRIPVGEMVLASPTATHFLPEFFPDPERFDIDRHLPERAEHKQRDAFAPFGVGTHRCLGAGFAEAQILLILASIIREAELVLHPSSYELKSTYSPVLRPQNLKVKFARRA